MNWELKKKMKKRRWAFMEFLVMEVEKRKRVGIFQVLINYY